MGDIAANANVGTKRNGSEAVALLETARRLTSAKAGDLIRRCAASVGRGNQLCKCGAFHRPTVSLMSRDVVGMPVLPVN